MIITTTTGFIGKVVRCKSLLGEFEGMYLAADQKGVCIEVDGEEVFVSCPYMLVEVKGE